MRKLLLLPLLFVAVSLHAAPNFAGTWKLDADASTGSPAAQGASLLIVTQTEDTLTFDYYPLTNGKRGALIQSDSYTLDGLDHPGHKLRTYITYTRAYWHKKALIVRTQGVMDTEGEQTFTDEENWFLSPDGNTLTDRSSDGKKAVYVRQPNSE
jgi:hypothetical protein